jgi:hypothetical protein
MIESENEGRKVREKKVRNREEGARERNKIVKKDRKRNMEERGKRKRTTKDIQKGRSGGTRG